jgi:predicted nucleic acid-binding protein
VCLRWFQSSDPGYPVVVKALSGLSIAGATLCYTSQNLAEFWNVCTRPASSNGYGLSIAEVDERAKLFESRLHLLPENLAVHIEWRHLVVAYRVSGAQVHDARLVASMHVHGVSRLLTFNQGDFLRYTDIETIHPGSISAATQ